MKKYTFVDTLTNKEITIICESEDSAWATLCDKFGSGYVFENIEITF